MIQWSVNSPHLPLRESDFFGLPDFWRVHRPIDSSASTTFPKPNKVSPFAPDKTHCSVAVGANFQLHGTPIFDIQPVFVAERMKDDLVHVAPIEELATAHALHHLPQVLTR